MISATARAICNRLLREPQKIEAIASKARRGDREAIDTIISICWLMAGFACSAEEDLLLAAVDREGATASGEGSGAASPDGQDRLWMAADESAVRGGTFVL